MSGFRSDFFSVGPSAGGKKLTSARPGHLELRTRPLAMSSGPGHAVSAPLAFLLARQPTPFASLLIDGLRSLVCNRSTEFMGSAPAQIALKSERQMAGSPTTVTLK